MVKVIREILALVWKLVRQLLEKWLSGLLKQLALYAVIVVTVIGLCLALVWMLTR